MCNKLDRKIAIIGLGYVGLPLAIEFGKKYDVLGFDVNRRRVEELENGEDHTHEADLDDLNEVKNGRTDQSGLWFSSNKEDLKRYNTYVVTVPTPIDQFKAPDLGPLLKASEMIGGVLKKGDVVIYESTVYPGCTEEDCVPVLENISGLKFNSDFFCGYSPER
ncbi:MAG TPA: Vi polysaccharide biosynthesis UDP-N-acetylglucosamine C-6 dehydrogenase TviB, partial [Candidatus Babeliaceae bacterium]|nr:Vi polysaccharide biosynthesis UDP-N-acetylglucosamine C-6 dehydrogenase TviB [Candidatus Babeliaceae bacterium]